MMEFISFNIFDKDYLIKNNYSEEINHVKKTDIETENNNNIETENNNNTTTDNVKKKTIENKNEKTIDINEVELITNP